MGRYFGPIMALWFLVMGTLGLMHLMRDPTILQALLPTYAIGFAMDHGLLTFVVLGSVFLAVTGAEALYADMGHFGRGPIRAAWVGILPCLTLNYLGQGSFVVSQARRRARRTLATSPSISAPSLKWRRTWCVCRWWPWPPPRR